MEQEFRHYYAELQRALGDAETELRLLQQIVRVAGSTENLQVRKPEFDTFTTLALSTSHAGVRDASVKTLVALLHSGRQVDELADEDLVTVCTSFVTDENLTLSCLFMLVLVLGAKSDDLVALAVQKGAIDILFRTALMGSPANPQALPQMRELCLKGFASLATNGTYALRLHEKDIWSLLYRMYEDGFLSSLTLLIIKSIILSIGMDTTKPSAPSAKSQQEPAAAAAAANESEESEEKNIRASIRATGSRLSQRIGSELRQRGGGADALVEALESFEETDAEEEEEVKISDPAADASEVDSFNSGLSREDYTEDEGLLRDQHLNEDNLDMASRICLHIDRKGIMGMMLSVCQTPDQEKNADYALSILGLLSRTMHRVIMRDNRIIIVRVLLNLIECMNDSRLVSVAFVLDSFLKQRGSRSIVLQCGSAAKCATKGLKLLGRKDSTSRDICQCLIQLIYHISTLPDGPAELSNQACINFLVKSMKKIGSAKLRKNSRGKEEWSGYTEVASLLTLINIAIESPVMASVAEAQIHKGLAGASKRNDELGLLAIIGSAFFVGKSASRSRSREIPRVQPALVDMLVDLLRCSAEGQPALGGIDWTTEELLQAINYLVQAPHNLYNLRSLMPVMVDTLRDSTAKDDSDSAGLAVEILLVMSYNKFIAKDMTDSDTLLGALADAQDLVPYECRRSLQTLVLSLENEASIAREAAAAGKGYQSGPLGAGVVAAPAANLRERITSMGRLSALRKSLSKQFSPSPQAPKGYVLADPAHLEDGDQQDPS